MKTDKEIEEMFGLTREDIEELAAPWEAGGRFRECRSARSSLVGR